VIVAAVIVAGAAGAVLRFAVSYVFAAPRYRNLPLAVLIVNVVGSAVGGAVLGLATGEVRLVLLSGLCGGLTTFSTFSTESIQLMLAGRWKVALGSIAANLVLGIGAAAAAFALVSA
jgi:CrcB protein